MQKFLSIPVTAELNQLVSCNDIKIIEVGDSGGPSSNPTTTTTLYYGSGKKVTLTHGAITAFAFRDFIQDSVVQCLQQMWHDVTLVIPEADLPEAVSGIAIA